MLVLRATGKVLTVALSATSLLSCTGPGTARKEGFADGERQATKQFYSVLQGMQEADQQADNAAYGEVVQYEVEVPGGEDAEGVRLVPHVVTIPIVE